MSQKPLDLLPESIRRDCQKGVRIRRYIAAVVAATVVVVVTSTHTRVQLSHAQESLAKARITADLVLKTEAQADELRSRLQLAEREIELHDRIAIPFGVSSLLATITNRLPESVSLDRIDFTITASRLQPRTARARKEGTADSSVPQRRLMLGEITGFAASDEDISRLIEALQETLPFGNATLDFSRTRVVRGHQAREFRMSFRFDVDSVIELPSQRAQASDSGHVR
jgi:Tfp pilus assembly protein PilN